MISTSGCAPFSRDVFCFLVRALEFPVASFDKALHRDGPIPHILLIDFLDRETSRLAAHFLKRSPAQSILRKGLVLYSELEESLGMAVRSTDDRAPGKWLPC